MLGAGRGSRGARRPAAARRNDCEPVSRLALVDLGANGSTGRRRTVVQKTDAVWQAAMRSSRRGRLAIAWIEVRDETTFRLRVVLRFASGRLTAPVTLARGDGIAPQVPAIDGLDVALTDDGAALVAYVQSRAAHLVTLRPDGTIARRRTLGASQESATVAVAPGDTFGLSHELRDAGGLVALAVRPDGAATVALSRDGYLTVRQRPAAGGSFTPLGRPTRDRVYDGDLAYTAAGDLLLAWGEEPENGPAQLFIARRG